MAIYMMRDDGRQPTGTTVGYRKFKENLNDYSGNNHNFSGSATYSNNMATFSRVTISGFSLLSYSGDYTVSMWTDGGGSNKGFYFGTDTRGYPSGQLYWGGTGSSIGFNYAVNGNRTGVYYNNYSGTGIHLLTGVKTSTTLTLYLDGVQISQTTGTYGSFTSDSSQNNTWVGNNVNGSGTITVGEVILDKKAWTAQEVLDYYNDTKSNYGIS